MPKPQSRPPTGRSGSQRPSNSRGGGRGAGGARPGSSRATSGGARPQATRKDGSTSIVNKPQRPWGLIAVVAALAVFAVAVIGYALWNGRDNDAAGGAAAQASRIPGIQVQTGLPRNHQTGTIQYAGDPPVGGNHNPYWADCTGTVYSQPIANENAVHALEHGAVWITYRPDISSDALAQLTSLVQGNDRMMLSPYPNQQSPVSLQSWGYRLAVDSPADSRVATFISLLRYNPQTTPEYGATCAQPTFKAHPSTFGSPLDGPAAG